MERLTGIEPVLPAWEAGVLPLYDSRIIKFRITKLFRKPRPMISIEFDIEPLGYRYKVGTTIYGIIIDCSSSRNNRRW